MYSKDEIDKLNNIYFDGACNDENRAKIYAYISFVGYYGQIGVSIRDSLEYGIRGIFPKTI